MAGLASADPVDEDATGLVTRFNAGSYDAYSLRALRHTWLAVLSAVVVAVVPFFYDAYPDIVGDSPFFLGARNWIIVVWVIFVGTLVHILALRQEKAQLGQADAVADIDAAVDRARESVSKVDEISTRVASTAMSISKSVGEVAFHAKIAALGGACEKALGVAWRLHFSQNPGLYPDPRFMMFVNQSTLEPTEDTRLWPAFPNECVIDPATAGAVDSSQYAPLGAVQRIFPVGQLWKSGQVEALVFLIKDSARARLHGPERRVAVAAGYPLLNEKHVIIGIMVAWWPLRSGGPAISNSDQEIMANFIADIAEELESLAVEAQRLIAGRAA